MESRLLEISSDHIDTNASLAISEHVAGERIFLKQKVLMIFERPNWSHYWYIATGYNDLVHAKKTHENTFVRFEACESDFWEIEV